MMRFVAMVALLTLTALAAYAEPAHSTPHVGDGFEIRHEYETEDKADDGSSGSSNGHTTIIERVVGVRADGLELEYDLPADATAEDRSREWQFPARLFRPFHGSPQLLNSAEMETRIDGWLKLAKLTRAECGKWYFTWNAFKVECDPQSVIASLEPYNLWVADLRDGALYRAPEAHEAAPLKAIVGKSPASYVAEMAVDPDTWRRERAEADLVAAQILGQPLTRDEAIRKRMAETVSGTIGVTLETDPTGQVRRSTKLIKLTLKGSDGKTETQTRTERVERRPISTAPR